jgi:hypothetical protein
LIITCTGAGELKFHNFFTISMSSTWLSVGVVPEATLGMATGQLSKIVLSQGTVCGFDGL